MSFRDPRLQRRLHARRPSFQHRVALQAQRIVEVQRVAEPQHCVAAEGAIGAQVDPRLRALPPNRPHQGPQHAGQPHRRPGFARAEQRRRRPLPPAVRLHGHLQRQETPFIVKAVEERELLLPVARIVGGIDVDHHPLGPRWELRHRRLQQRRAEPHQLGRGARVLKPGQRRLAGWQDRPRWPGAGRTPP